MGNFIFDIARKKFALAEIDWDDNLTTTIKALLLSDNAVPVDETSTDMTAAGLVQGSNDNRMGTTYNVVGGGVAIVNRAVDTNGACKSTDATITFVDIAAPAGHPTYKVGGLVIYLHTDAGDDSLNVPLIHIDSATGLPITPNGGDIIVTWDTGVNKIFRL